MLSKDPLCPLHGDRFPRAPSYSAGPSIDPQTRQALFQLHAQAEEIALELTARLRVLGKGLSAACRSSMAGDGAGTTGYLAYTHLRRQLEGFLGSRFNHGDFCKSPSFDVLREFLQKTLPLELRRCIRGESCRIEIIEALITILSGNVREHEGIHERTGAGVFVEIR